MSGVLYRFSLKNPLIASNLYLYVGNNPINRIDLFGLQWHKSPAVWLDIIALGADIGGYLVWRPLLSVGLASSVLNTVYNYQQWKAGQAESYDFFVSLTTTIVGSYPHPVTVIGSDIIILVYDIIRAEQAYSEALGWCPREIKYPREPIEKIIPPGMPMP